MISRRVRGTRTPIPAGKVVGRLPATGQGDARLVDIADIARAAVASGAIVPPGSPGALNPIATHTFLANPTGSTAQPIATTLAAGTNITITYGASTVTVASSGGSVTNLLPIVDSAGTPIQDADGVFIGTPSGTTTNVWDASSFFLVQQQMVADTYQQQVRAHAVAQPLTTATAVTIASITLTEGTWDITGNVSYLPDVTTTTSDQWAGISDTTNTLPAFTTAVNALAHDGSAYPAGSGANLPTGLCRQTIAVGATKTLYLVAQATFAVSTNKAYGYIRATRMY